MQRPITISGLHAAYADGLAPAEVLDSVYDAIDAAADPGIFLALVDRQAAKAVAAALGPFDPAAKPLWGVPFAVKDNIDVAGMPTTAACAEFAYVAAKTAFAVERLLAAGAILIGKTNLDQFATGLVGVRTPFAVPRNAIDATLVPGGSSSGSAVAVARSIVPFALGTDTAGSGRVPAALNNIVGLKPSLGAISTSGVVPACRSLDCISIFALTVDDAWQVLTVMAAHDVEDAFSRPIELGRPALPPIVRVGVPNASSRVFLGDDLAEVAFDAALADLTALHATAGVRVERVDVDLAPFRAVADLLYSGPWVAERYQAIRQFIDRGEAAMHPITREIITSARRYSAADAFAGLYRLADLRKAAMTIWQQIDVLCVPSIPKVATLADIARDPTGVNSELGLYTNFVNLLDLSALAVPGRWRSDARPAGITLIAQRGGDHLLAALGARLHAEADVGIGATQQRPPLPLPTPPAAPAGYYEIAVVGAHMSGLPLNDELKRNGGVFVRATETERSYRFYALAGTKPQRPGLLRVAAHAGHAIAAEVWALPPAGFAAFVSGIPSPLGIGTLQLADGTTAKGFLVEHAGLVDAKEISSLGGWRAYLAVS